MRKLRITIVLGFCLLALKPALGIVPGQLGRMVGTAQEADGVGLKFENGILKLSQVSEGIIQVRATGQKQFAPEGSFALAPDAPRPKPLKFQEQETEVVFETSLLTLKLSRENGILKIFDKQGNLLLAEPEAGGIKISDTGSVSVARSMPAQEHYYGFGEKTGPFDKRGQKMAMWNSDQMYFGDSDPLYQSHPFYLALNQGRAYGIFLDNSYRSEFDLGKTNPGLLSYQVSGGGLNYYFIYGPSPKEVLRGYASLVGKYPLPPLWALGYMQCRYSYRNEHQIRSITSQFRKNNVPCDVIFFDIHYLDHYKVFTFNRKRFPDPKGLLSDLEKQGFKAIVIVDPGVKVEPGYPVYDEGLARDYFVREQSGGNFPARVWPGNVYFPDFLKPEVRDWWGALHKFYLDLGVDGIWNDMNEPAGWEKDLRPVPDLMVPFGKVNWLDMVHGPRDNPVAHAKIHNVYALLEAEATYNGLKKLAPGQRPFIISRAGYPGLQRYSCIWTGDNAANWYQVEMTLSMLLNLSLSGTVMAGADIGGFVGTPSPEMYARWIQQGVFYPFARTHTAIYHKSQDPFSFGKEVMEISKSAIELRYRLLPYTYSYFYEESRTGLPIMRALLLEFPGDEKTYQLSSQYLWGEWIMVAPVVKPGAKTREIYLPAGKWYWFEKAEPMEGGKTISVPVELSSLPVLVRAGGIIPLAPVMNYTGEKPWAPLSLEFYAGEQKTCLSLYEDSGDGFNYQNGEYLLTSYCQEPVPNGLLLVKEEGKGRYQPVSRELVLTVFGAKKPSQVQISSGAGWDQAAYSYDSGSGTLEMRVKDQIKGFKIQVSY